MQKSYWGVLGWLAALTNCWNIFLSFIGSIPRQTTRYDIYSVRRKGKNNRVERHSTERVKPNRP